MRKGLRMDTREKEERMTGNKMERCEQRELKITGSGRGDGQGDME